MAIIRGAKGKILVGGKVIATFDDARYSIYSHGPKMLKPTTTIAENRSGSFTFTLTQMSASWGWCLFMTQNYLYAIEMWLSGKAGFTVSLFTTQQIIILGPMFSTRNIYE